jgi:hypothetical protein
MSWLRRLAIVVSLILAGLLSFTATTMAFEARGVGSTPILGKGGGGGGGLPAAGNYQNSNVFAGFFLCCAGPSGTMQVSVDVSHNTSVSKPLAGPSTSTDEVDVQFYVNDYLSGLFVSGCIIPDGASDFTVNTSLTSATLNTTVQATTRTCLGQTLNGVTPPFTLSATWAVSGPTSSSQGVSKYSCGKYTSETQTSTGGSANATASFSASFLTASISPIDGGNLFSFSQSTHAQGVAADGCIELGGKGAGPGPQGPGTYTNSSMSASMQVQPDDTTQQPFGVFATSFTNTAHPVGGPISTQTETDLNLFQFSSPAFVQECWVMPAGDLTIAGDLHAASLNVSIDATTPACQSANNTGPSVLAINATWNATSPVATFSNTGQSSCGGFHVAGTVQGSGVTATATGSWPGTASAFTDTNAFLSINSTTSHQQGTFSGC